MCMLSGSCSSNCKIACHSSKCNTQYKNGNTTILKKKKSEEKQVKGDEHISRDPFCVFSSLAAHRHCPSSPSAWASILDGPHRPRP